MPRKPSRPAAPISDALVALIDQSGRAPHELAILAGISPSSLSRFLGGKASLRLDSLDALAGVLGLKLTGAARRPRRGAVEQGAAADALPS